jgi:hypothetical protein
MVERLRPISRPESIGQPVFGQVKAIACTVGSLITVPLRRRRRIEPLGIRRRSHRLKEFWTILFKLPWQGRAPNFKP